MSINSSSFAVYPSERGEASISSPFSPCGRRCRRRRRKRGAPAWRRRRSATHPSSVSALRADPPSPTRGEGRPQLTRLP
ncbi:MAG: hypothetical protein EOR97_12180 [Mesorhizobium sp.]|nr:MAG: hypothetical protein EOR97_12180 [Mesorhizobium sp.]